MDVTPPEIVDIPVLSPSFSLKSGTQFDRSLISLDWLFQDGESPVWSHSVSVHTHHDNQGPVDGLLVGDVHHITTTLDSLMKDGNRYTASVTACNGAGLCATAESAEFLVDSSPPHLGGFVEPMSWENTGSSSSIVHLSWEGYDDAHSGISHYHIMISSTYNGYDLSGGILNIAHNNSVKTQTATFSLSKEITPYSMVYLSIWAENGVGLISDAAKAGVFPLKSSPTAGRLDIEKHSCDIHYCSKDCACAVVNQPCEPEGIIPDCHEVDASYVHVHDGATGIPVNMTSSTKCLRAFWERIDTSKPVTRYEWTVGAKGSVPGSPIFDRFNEKYWFDVELHDNWVYCLRGKDILEQGLDYIYYIKAWHGFDEYSLYSSGGVIIDSTPPKIGIGRAVRDMDANFQTEVDFTTDTSSLHADWTGVFNDAETEIYHYEVSVGTTPGGNEIYGPEIVARTTSSLTNLTLIPGFCYFTTIHAYNPLGLVTSMSSDGVVVDLQPPLPGIVYSSLTFQDAAHHMEQLTASWHGFEDLHSFIKDYEWAVGKEGEDIESLQFHNVGLETTVVIPQDFMTLEDGMPYAVHVRAFDAAGHVSPIATSRSTIMDTSPPLGQKCSRFVDVPGDWSFSCAPCNTSECSEDYTVCSVVSPISVKENQFIKVILTSPHDHESLRARLQVGKTWDWIQFEQEGSHQYSHYTNVLSQTTETIRLKLYLFKGELREVDTLVQVCEHPMNSSTPLSVQQAGSVGVHLHWAVTDPESGIASIHVGLGTNDGGFQLLPLTDVGQSSSLLIPVRLQHSMKVSDQIR